MAACSARPCIRQVRMAGLRAGPRLRGRRTDPPFPHSDSVSDFFFSRANEQGSPTGSATPQPDNPQGSSSAARLTRPGFPGFTSNQANALPGDGGSSTDQWGRRLSSGGHLVDYESDTGHPGKK